LTWITGTARFNHRHTDHVAVVHEKRGHTAFDAEYLSFILIALRSTDLHVHQRALQFHQRVHRLRPDSMMSISLLNAHSTVSRDFLSTWGERNHYTRAVESGIGLTMRARSAWCSDLLRRLVSAR
jgi:hypothetical protein